MADTKVEIARSFSYKLNAGNYESRDFFCSQKAECSFSDSERISEALYTFCKEQVMRAVNQYRREQQEATLEKDALQAKRAEIMKERGIKS